MDYVHYTPLRFNCRRHCPRCNKTRRNECHKLWPNVPQPKICIPLDIRQPKECSCVSCVQNHEQESSNKSSIENSRSAHEK
ncbi:hypothetical protein JTE90_007849 [Oedothorax gibbosus]|uniref:Uncharacterized protein n=1 Tax=Oedothorax gibbosus TaxID=931172 RepID=A0AAV6VK89_9ARAC|nr:hypothetical protein JTE90_007849 [Oedothorax gibbosus]